MYFSVKKLLSLAAVGVVAATVFAGCDTHDQYVPENSDSYTQGDCAYADHQGNPQPQATPAPQPEEKPMEMEIRMNGMASLSGLKPECSAGGGNFTGLLSGNGKINQGGSYFAGYVFSEGSFSSGGCSLPPVNVDTLGEVVVRAKLSNTQKNCETYCETRARSYAESQCGTSSSQAACRAQVEAQYESTCTQRCTGTTTRRIVAEARLGLAAIAALNARSLGVNGLGTIDANLTFDRIEEQNGTVVQER